MQTAPHAFTLKPNLLYQQPCRYNTDKQCDLVPVVCSAGAEHRYGERHVLNTLFFQLK